MRSRLEGSPGEALPIPPSAPFPGGAEAAHAERLFALSQDLLGAADAHGYLRWVNAAWERTTGWTPAELYARPYADFMHREDRATVLLFAERLEHTPRGESLQVEARALCKDGSYRWFRCSAAVATEGPEPLVYLSATDVTDLHEAVEQLAGERTRSVRRTAELERSNAELERFAGVVSHDLRQSLTAVSGFLALLESRFGAQLPEGAEALLALARESSERMHSLVEDLLAYARVGHSGRAPELVDTGELVHRLAATAAAGAVLEIGELPTVLARPREFEQLLANLISNGVKFVAPGVKPRVSILALPEGATWRFEIADNGIGVAAPHAQRIFGMFARSPAGDQYPGTGIGLAIAQKVVEAAGGRIWVQPREGGGSVFCFTWPALT